MKQTASDKQDEADQRVTKKVGKRKTKRTKKGKNNTAVAENHLENKSSEEKSNEEESFEEKSK